MARVPQGRSRSRKPAQGMRLRHLADEQRVRQAVGYIVEFHMAVQEEHAVVVGSNRGLDVVMAARVTRQGDLP